MAKLKPIIDWMMIDCLEYNRCWNVLCEEEKQNHSGHWRSPFILRGNYINRIKKKVKYWKVLKMWKSEEAYWIFLIHGLVYLLEGNIYMNIKKSLLYITCLRQNNTAVVNESVPFIWKLVCLRECSLVEVLS